MKTIDQYITSIPDFPEPGVVFRDITTVLNDADALRLAVDALAELVEGLDCDVVVGLESRGFLFGMPVAYKLGKPFVPIRKKGKLPRATVGEDYELEYGTATIEVHRDDLCPGARVALVDDLVATGGTLDAAHRLVERVGAQAVGAVCLIELKGLGGRANIGDLPLRSVVAYEGK